MRVYAEVFYECIREREITLRVLTFELKISRLLTIAIFLIDY